MAGSDYLTVDKYIKAHKRLWYAVLVITGFLFIAVILLAYTLRHEGIQRAASIRAITQQNRALITQNGELAIQGKQAHDVLCADRNNLSSSIDRTEKLLHQFPESTIFGIPRELFIAGLRDDKRQLETYNKNLKCEEE